MNPIKKRWILALALLLVAALFAFVDFRLAWSRTKIEHEGVTTAIDEGLPYLMRDRSNLALSVTGARSLNPALQKKVLAALRDTVSADVTLLPDIRLDAGRPYVMVRVLETKGFWTPLFATSRVVVQMGFGSNGSMGHVLSEHPPAYSNTDGPGIFAEAKYTLTDTSLGILSFPGYNSLLANEFAAKISAAVGDLYNRK